MSKKGTRTLDELVKKALIPEDEKPFPIPENWVWIKLGSFYQICNEQMMPRGNEHYIGLEHLNKNGGINAVGKSDHLKSKKALFKSGDVLYGKLRPYLNKHVIVDFNGLASTDILVFRSPFGESNIFLNGYLGLDFVVRFSNENSSGINLPRVSPNKMKVLPVPLPPLEEQKRINLKVNQLIKKIEDAEYLVEKAKESFLRRRAAILDKAFRGNLTTEWREENQYVEDATTSINNIRKNFELNKENKRIKLLDRQVLEKPYELPPKWCWARIGEIFHVQVGSTPKRKVEEYWNGNLPWVSSGEVKFNYIEEVREFITSRAAADSNLKLAPKGSVLFGMIGEGKTRGQAAILNMDSYHNQNVASIWVPDTEIMSEFVYYWLLFQYEKNRQNSSGNSQPAYNKSRVQSLNIPIPPLQEQRLITNYIQSIIRKDSKASKLDNIEEELKNLKGSIISKAYMGGLETGSNMDHSAIDLLKEVLSHDLGE